MSENKASIRAELLVTGRRLVEEKGAEFLTARKLSEASGFSVGMIYGQYSNMDKFIEALNIETLSELYQSMRKYKTERNAYKNLNNWLDAFVSFVLLNSNRWFLLYNYHLRAQELPMKYKTAIIKLTRLWEPSFNAVYSRLNPRKRKLARQVLWLSLFALSSFLTTRTIDNLNMINKKNLCKLMLNTYLAGIAVLRKG